MCTFLHVRSSRGFQQGSRKMTKRMRTLALSSVALSVLILIPGLFLPVLTVKGTLNPEGISDFANKILEQGMTDSALQTIRPLINPAMLPFLEGGPGGLKGAFVSAIGNQISNQLNSGAPIEVYSQTRSIVGSVRHLYSVG